MNATATIAPAGAESASTGPIAPAGAEPAPTAGLIAPAGAEPTPTAGLIAPAGAESARPAAAGGPQYMRALERANQVRLARAELKRRVAAGEISACDVILECPWETDSMAIGDLLMTQRRWGQTRCRKFLAQIPMSEQKTIGSMTERQRRTLAALLSADAPITVTRPWLAPPRPSGSLSPAALVGGGR